MKTWTVLRQLTWAQRRTLLVAVILLPLCAALLRCTSLARLLPRVKTSGACAPAALADARAAARAVDLVAARFRAPCLARSLALQWILAGRGIATVLRVGVRHRDGLHAHAWLECNGLPVNDSVEGVRGFAPLELP